MIKLQERREAQSLQDMRNFVTIQPNINKRKKRKLDTNDHDQIPESNQITRPTKQQGLIKKFFSILESQQDDVTGTANRPLHMENITCTISKEKRKATKVEQCSRNTVSTNIQTTITRYLHELKTVSNKR